MAVLDTFDATIAKPDSDEVERCKAAAPKPTDAEAAYESQRVAAEQHLARLGSLILPRLFVGVAPYLAVIFLCGIVGVATQAALKAGDLQIKPVGIAIGVTLVVAIVLGFLLSRVAKNKILHAYLPFREAIAIGYHATDAELVLANATREHRLQMAGRRRNMRSRRHAKSMSHF